MKDWTVQLEAEAMRLGSPRGFPWKALTLTAIPFAATVGVLLVLGGQVQEKRRELAAKNQEVQDRTKELTGLQKLIGEAREQKDRIEKSLEKAKAELAAVDAKIAQAASVLDDPTINDPQQRMEQANRLLVGNTSLGRAQELWKAGYAAYNKNDLQTAERLFLAAKQADPRYAPPYNSLGNLKYKAGDLEQALDLYRQALALRPAYAPSHYNMALVYAKLGQKDKALTATNEALKIRPGYADAKALKLKLLGAPASAKPARTNQLGSGAGY